MNKFNKLFFILLVLSLTFVGRVFAEDYTPVVTPNGSTLAYKMVNGVKEFKLTVEEIEHEFSSGMNVKCWGYNSNSRTHD